MLRESDRLKEYRARRDFSRTPEPAPKRARRTRGKLRYLIQKHAARRLHYDFRLEHDGALLSWAVPKGPSFDTADKRLAVRTEDHPLEYGKFEGTIPEGEYGAGTVMLWDTGTWVPDGDPGEGLDNGKLAFTLHGKRLKGKWALVRLRGSRRDKGKQNWLLIKERDEFAGPEKRPVVERELKSVETGRTTEEIARGRRVWHSNRARAETAVRERKAARRKRRSPRSKRKANNGARRKRKSRTGDLPLPRFVAPQLASLVDTPPPGDDWLHEIKYDGYRAIAAIGGASVKIYTRKGLDWTARFHPLLTPLADLPCENALLDGEIAVADADADAGGHTDFGALQNALSDGRGGFGYYLFDLLHLDGKDLRRLPLIERKEKLRALLGAVRRAPLFYSDHVEGAGMEAFRNACDLKLEGLVSKAASAPYRSGRARSWLKSKCGNEQEFVIAGWMPSDKAKRPFSSVIVAVNAEGKLRYAGRVGSGFDDDMLDELAALFARHARKTPAVEGVPAPVARRARFIEPRLIGEFAFHGWTGDGLVRQGSFKGLREDKSASEIVRERPMASSSRTGKRRETVAPAKAKAASIRGSDGVEIEGVRVTHPDRVLWPKQGITKRALIDYYLKVADRMLPHVAGRPLALVRCPRGAEQKCFFQKHANPGWPRDLKKIRIREKSGVDDYLYLEDKAGLVAAVRMGVLELHLWCARTDEVEQPDRLVFDLDPDAGLDFSEVKKAARELKRRLDDLGLKSFPLATGGKGIHVVVPLTRGHSWDEHRNFAEALARVMAEEQPERYVATMSKAKRRGKIFIDYLRNQRGASAIAPYSSRVREAAPVAWPVSWPQLARLKNARPASVDKQPRGTGDPWRGYFKVRQRLPGMGS